jgi:tetratricopeptide (TPR) repeat protein
VKQALFIRIEPTTVRTELVEVLRKSSLCLFACATVLIAACAGSATVKQDNALVKTAQNIERRAAQSFAAGDFDSAAAGYESAALVYETLALPDPQARARLSQARALADAGHSAKALNVVGSVLQSPSGLSADVLATAHGRAAAFTLGSDLPLAQSHVQSALAACANTCTQLSAITVLRARTELAANHLAAATASASAALAAAQTPNDRANALRTRAQTHAAQSQHAQVLPDAQQALLLDQEVGAAPRVLTDLQLLQAAYAALGDTANAARYAALANRAIAAGAALRGDAGK